MAQIAERHDVGPPDAQEMLELVNQERKQSRCSTLKADERLNASAQEKADDMTSRNHRDHVSRGNTWVSWHLNMQAENVGMLARTLLGEPTIL